MNTRYFKEIQEKLAFKDFNNFTFEEEIDYRISKAIPFIRENNFETSKFINDYVIKYFLRGNVLNGVLTKNGISKNVYIISNKKNNVVYLCDEENRFYKSSIKEIKELLDSGWNNSLIKDYITQSK